MSNEQVSNEQISQVDQHTLYICDFRTCDQLICGRVHVLARTEDVGAKVFEAAAEIIRKFPHHSEPVQNHLEPVQITVGPGHGTAAAILPIGRQRYRVGFQIFTRGPIPVLLSCIIEASSPQEAKQTATIEAADYQIGIDETTIPGAAANALQKPLILIEPILLS